MKANQITKNTMVVTMFVLIIIVLFIMFCPTMLIEKYGQQKVTNVAFACFIAGSAFFVNQFSKL